MTDTKTCQYCGTAVPADSETCIMCGSPLNPPVEPRVEAVLEAPAAPQPEPAPAEVLPPPSPRADAPEPPVVIFDKAPRSPSNRWLAVAIEVLAGLVGFLGIGWMIAGKIVTGIILLIGYWFFLLGYGILLFSQINATDGWSLAALCCVPIFPLISGLVLYLRTK